MKIKRSDCNNIWITSDWHTHHNKEFIYKYRGFDNIEAHDEFIVTEYNKLVDVDDIVFHLGDVVFGDANECKALIDSLNCNNKYFITGNHDKALTGYFHNVRNVGNLGKLFEMSIIDDEIFPITLCHYPMMLWNRSHYGSWNLCGHSHGGLVESLPSNIEGKRLDVGIDVGLKFNSKFMFTFEDVKCIMDSKKTIGHH